VWAVGCGELIFEAVERFGPIARKMLALLVTPLLRCTSRRSRSRMEVTAPLGPVSRFRDRSTENRDILIPPI
jgi:hypothetical protein